ncbi:YybH family protein [Gilvibacter sp.]|uniref:YybH family protein n=1 Tax=Gilvibacter sp. TaxID=2729997 RepID=UPI003F4A5AEF
MKLKHLITVVCLLFLSQQQFAQSQQEQDKTAILKVMADQSKAWSNHDLEGFMEGYWKSDSLKFYGSGGLVKGWQATLERYQKSYPTAEHTGVLKFTIDDVSPAGTDSYTVMGRFYLSRDVGDANGVFLVVFRKINGQWKIVADMSC